MRDLRSFLLGPQVVRLLNWCCTQRDPEADNHGDDMNWKGPS